jgi:hypothetical protein
MFNIASILSILKKIWEFGKKNYKLIILAYAVVATLLFVYMSYRNSVISEEKNRYESNQTALLQDIENYVTENGKNAAKVTQLELTASEYEKLCTEQADKIKELGISLKRLELASTTATTTNVVGNTTLKDSVIVYRTDTISVVDTIKYFKWSDTWNSIEGKIKGNNVVCSYNGTDTLTVAIHKVPKKFWFIKYGCKYVQVDIVNQNPSSKVTYNQTVKFK